MRARIKRKRTSGGRAFPLLVKRSGPEKKIRGAQRQRMGKVFLASLTGSLDVSARAVREMPRIYPPSPRARRKKMGSFWVSILTNCSQERREKAAVG